MNLNVLYIFIYNKEYYGEEYTIHRPIYERR